jgi:RND superfamily putative drug exporter
VAILSFDAPASDIQEEVAAIRTALADSALETYVTGEAAVDADLAAESMSDLRRVELYALPVALAALLVVFGTVVAAALPVITGVLAVSVTLGVIYLLARVAEMSIFSMNTATLLGLALAIDYALFIVARFREELAAGASVNDAVVTSMTRAGRSVFFSGLAVMVGVLGLTFFPFAAMRSLGAGAVLVVFFSVLASLTFMPALLSVLGPRVNSLHVVRQRPTHESRYWNGYAAFLLKKPWLVVAVSLVLILFVASPVLGIRTAMPSANALPASSESRQGYDILAADFDRAALSPISVLVTWEGGSPTVDMTTALPLYAFGRQLEATPGVAAVTSIFNLPGMENPEQLTGMWEIFDDLFAAGAAELAALPPEGLVLPSGEAVSAEQLSQIMQLVTATVGERAVLFSVNSEALPSSVEAQNLSQTIATLEMPPGFAVQVAGEAASERDFFNGLFGRMPWVALWIALASYLILAFLLRSILLPVVALVVNALTIAMSYGLIVFIFQHGRFASLLNFTPTGATDAIIVVVMLCVLFGITMDYAVFLLTRMHEHWDSSRDNRASVGAGVVRSGRIVLSAALLVVVVTGAFAFTRISITQMLGLGIALAIIADALLVRMALLPASMCYFGAANWWMPAWMRTRPQGPPASLKERRRGARSGLADPLRDRLRLGPR